MKLKLYKKIIATLLILILYLIAPPSYNKYFIFDFKEPLRHIANFIWIITHHIFLLSGLSSYFIPVLILTYPGLKPNRKRKIFNTLFILFFVLVPYSAYVNKLLNLGLKCPGGLGGEKFLQAMSNNMPLWLMHLIFIIPVVIFIFIIIKVRPNELVKEISQSLSNFIKNSKSRKTIKTLQIKNINEVKGKEYKIPEIDDNLEEPPEDKISIPKEEVEKKTKRIEDTLSEFDVKGKVVGNRQGPVITRYEIELAPGVKISKLESLDEDIALDLAVPTVMISRVPNQSIVGIDLPNNNPQIIHFKDIIKSKVFNPAIMNIPLVVGKDIIGSLKVVDLTEAPHYLIAGQTGSGKSCAIHAFIASILFSKTPFEVRLILVDPKVVELNMYNKIPHLLFPVVSTPSDAVRILGFAVEEMEKRCNILAEVGARNVTDFNKKVKQGNIDKKFLKKAGNSKISYIVIVLDELADLMATTGKEVEASIVRLAQKGRATGIHLIVATQRPEVSVVTGLIKSNLPGRIAFKVAQAVDSRIILDINGAEKLLGKGDMILKNDKEINRFHGAWISSEEIERIVGATVV